MATLSHPPAVSKPPKERRSYNWGTILYEESAVPGWGSLIESSGVPAVASPLHDKDELEDGSGLKKPHWHILFRFSSLKSRSQAKEFFESFGGVGAEDIKSMPGAVQYLWHMNSPDKAQYEKEGCICFNGFLVDKYMPQPDRNESFVRLVQTIEAHDLVYYNDLVLIVMQESPDLIASCRRDSYSIVSYLKAREARIRQEEQERKMAAERQRHESYAASHPPSDWRKLTSEGPFG